MIEDDDLLELYNTFCDKASFDIKEKFNSDLIYNKKFLKIKIKIFRDQAIYFYDKKIPKVGSNHNSLAVIIVDSALEKDEVIIRKCFQKNAHILEKKKTSIDILLMS